MKKIFSLPLFFVFTICGNFSANAQVMAAKSQWVSIKSENLHCWECKERLESYLTRENRANMDNGLLKWIFNLLAGEIKLQYLPDRVSPDEIRVAMNNAGFYADTTSPEPSAYKKLPASCKTKTDGGGPKKNQPCHLEP